MGKREEKDNNREQRVGNGEQQDVKAGRGKGGREIDVNEEKMINNIRDCQWGH